MNSLKVFVYYNLHRKCWSVKALEGPNKGLVIAYRDHMWLEDCTFKVSQAGRNRVLRERRKNVHAGVVGTWYTDETDECVNSVVSFMTKAMIPATYNPYKFSTFVNKDTHQCINHAKDALLTNRQVYVQ